MDETLILFLLLFLLISALQPWLLMRFVRNWLEKQTDQNLKILKEVSDGRQAEGFKTMLPLRIQAAERVVLFLERLQPQQLIGRHLEEGQSADLFLASMLRGIREEFDYNLSQQLFLSDAAWQLTKAAKEQVIQMIHLSRADLPQDASAASLATAMMSGETAFIDQAIRHIRDELNRITL